MDGFQQNMIIAYVSVSYSILIFVEMSNRQKHIVWRI